MKIQVGQCRVITAKNGSDIPKFYVTPAEVQILREVYQSRAGRDPITELQLIGVVERDPRLEALRLRNKYGALKVSSSKGKANAIEHLFPGAVPVLPKDFDQIGFVGLPMATLIGPQQHKPAAGEEFHDEEWAKIEAELKQQLALQEANAKAGIEVAPQVPQQNLSGAPKLPEVKVPVDLAKPAASFPQPEPPPAQPAEAVKKK